jgi:hypothetical protein
MKGAQDGNGRGVDAEVHVETVEVTETRGGNKRYKLRDDAGREYTTFREQIGERALSFRGRRARIEFHEEQRGRYVNVYLDRVEESPSAGAAEPAPSDPEEAAWQTAVEAAPWLMGDQPPEEGTTPEELFERLKPFKDLVAEDIREDHTQEAE